MRSLVHYRTNPQGRLLIQSAPPVGSETIFSENYIANRCDFEQPGAVDRQGRVVPLPNGTIITVTPQQGRAMTFRVDSRGPYDPPTYTMIVYFCTRLT